MEQAHLALNTLAPPGPGRRRSIVFVKASEVLFPGMGHLATLALWQAGCLTSDFEAAYRKCESAMRLENGNDGDERADSPSQRT